MSVSIQSGSLAQFVGQLGPSPLYVDIPVSVGAGDDRALLVLMSCPGVFDMDAPGATYLWPQLDGVDMTLAARTWVAANNSGGIWYALGPSVGVHTVRVGVSAWFGGQVYVTVVAATGVHQSTPIGAAVAHSSGGNASPQSRAVTVAAGGLAIAVAGIDGAGTSLVAGAGETTLGTTVNWSSQQFVHSYKPNATQMGYSWSAGTPQNHHVVVPLNPAPEAAALGGNVDVSAAVAAGTIATSPSDLGGNVTADAAVAAGSMGSQPGTVTTDPLRDKFTGALLAGATVPKIAFVRVSDMAAVLTVVDALTNGAGRLVTSNAALVAGVKYLVVTCNSDGSAYGAEVYTAT